MLGGHDVNVDVADTEAGYRRNLPDPELLQIRHYPDATHSMLRDNIAKSTVETTLVGVFAPRSLFATGVLDAQRDFVRSPAVNSLR